MNRLKKYGLTIQDYYEILKGQRDKCACCGRGAGTRGWNIDHDHNTGEVRGLLCSGCNLGIGSLGDTLEGARCAVAYLERFEARRTIDEREEAIVRMAFTDKSLAALEPPTDKPQLYAWDSKQPGFGYVLGRSGVGTFVVSYYRGDRKVRETLGRRDELTLPEARKRAQAVVGRVAEGKVTPGDQRKAAKKGPTLAEAVKDYLEALANRGARPRSIETVRIEIEHPQRSYLKAWLHRPLREITARECREKHADISLRCGMHVANRVMRELRSLWNHVSREALVDDSTWPANPTMAVNWHAGDRPGFVERRREPLTWGKLPEWRLALDKLSPVRRDYNLVVLLTGLRRTDACTIRWGHVNLENEPVKAQVWHQGKQIFETVSLAARSMLRPSPKGGAERAFVVPLSDAVVEILRRRKVENAELGADDKGWAFPARITSAKACSPCAELGLGPHVPGVSHMAEPKETDELIVSPHRLRDTYLTATEEIDGMPEGVAQVLVNHKLSNKTVTAGYRKQDLELLRRWQEKISEFLLSRMKPAPADRHLKIV